MLSERIPRCKYNQTDWGDGAWSGQVLKQIRNATTLGEEGSDLPQQVQIADPYTLQTSLPGGL